MGWKGRLSLFLFAGYCGYTAWDLYKATSAPLAEGRVPQSLQGLSKDELKAIPDVLVNKIDPGSHLTFDVILSQYPALPSLEQLKQHMAWHLKQRNSPPPEFSLVGTARLRPYSFEEDEEEEVEEEEQHETEASLTDNNNKEREKERETAEISSSGKEAQELGEQRPKSSKKIAQQQEGLFSAFFSFFRKAGNVWRTWRDYLDVSSGNIATLTATIPEHYRHGNHTLYLHVFVTDEKGNELPLHQVRQFTTYMVPEKHKVIKRYLLQDPTGKLLEEKLEGLQVPGPAVQCAPEFVMIGPVVEHRPLHLPTLTYILPPYVSADISPQDEYRPLEASPLDAVQPDAEQEETSKPLLINVMYQPVGELT
ncbi:hypothetical protein Emed_001850 [Eimeria media]